MLSDKDAVYICYDHEFETTNLDNWFKHKLSIPHYDGGVGLCVYCNRKVKFDNLKQENMDYIAPAICPECAVKNETVANADLIIKPEIVDATLNTVLKDCPE